MTDTSPRFLPLQRIFVVAGIVLGLGLLIGIPQWLADRRWEEMRTQVFRILGEELSRPAERPSLRVDPEPGNAWEDYAGALESIALKEGDGTLLKEFQDRDPLVVRAKVDGLLARISGIPEQLRRGAGRSSAKAVYRSAAGASGRKFPSSSFSAVGNGVGAYARVLEEQGRALEAAELLLDLTQFSLDLARGFAQARFSSPIVLASSLDGFRWLLLSGELSGDELLFLGTGLARLDQEFPQTGIFDQFEVLELGFEFLESKNLFQDIRTPRCMCSGHACAPWGAWRYGFSDRLMVANAFLEAIDYSRQASAGAALPWDETRKLMESIQSQLAGSVNPITRSHVAGLLRNDEGSRGRLTQLRLLRAGAAWQAAGKTPDLADPFGGRLLFREKGSMLTLWGVGRDGMDNQGAGKWSATSDPGKDLVLQLDN